MEGLKEVLGIWIEKTEGAKFWLQVLTELKNRGVKDILVASVDGLTGFPDAISAGRANAGVGTTDGTVSLYWNPAASGFYHVPNILSR